MCSERYAWTPSHHPNNDYGVGYLTPIEPATGRYEREAFEERAAQHLYVRYGKHPGDPVYLPPLGSMVRYGNLYPVVMHDFRYRRRKRFSKGTPLGYEDLMQPFTESRLLVYNGCHNSRRDPRVLAEEHRWVDLCRGCQTQHVSDPNVVRSVLDEGMSEWCVVVYVERWSKLPGAVIAHRDTATTLRRYDATYGVRIWSVRTVPHVDRTRGHDFPFAQLACDLWYRPPMGRLEFTARQVCRSMTMDLLHGGNDDDHDGENW